MRKETFPNLTSTGSSLIWDCLWNRRDCWTDWFEGNRNSLTLIWYLWFLKNCPVWTFFWWSDFDLFFLLVRFPDPLVSWGTWVCLDWWDWTDSFRNSKKGSKNYHCYTFCFCKGFKMNEQVIENISLNFNSIQRECQSALSDDILTTLFVYENAYSLQFHICNLQSISV